MTALVTRDDLSARSALSKSTLAEYDLCQTKAWHALYHRLPAVPNERMTFGSAVDAAIETAVKFLRSEQSIEYERCMAAAHEVIARDEVAVDSAEVERALDTWLVTVAPRYDFRYARTQHRISGTLPDLGDVDGHPDVWLADGRIFDVKTSSRAKPEEMTTELAFYALIAQEVEGIRVPAVGYWTWVRIGKPYWQTLEFTVTDEWLQWAVETAAAYVRAARVDRMHNERTEHPNNWAFGGGPSFPSLCSDCQYATRCPRVRPSAKGEGDDAA